jgi:CIC family chloride channel protein
VIFAVVDSEKNLLGIVHNDIREIIFNTYRVKYTLVREIMIEPTEIISPDDSMEMVMNKFEKSKKSLYQLFKEENILVLFLNLLHLKRIEQN